MKTTEKHCTLEHLNILLDGRMSAREEKGIRDHLAACAKCRLAHDNLAGIHAALQSMPIAQTRPDFTRSVLDRLVVASKSSLAFRLLEKVSYVFGLFIVLGIMIAAFTWSGVLDQTQLAQTESVASGVVDRVGGSLSAFLGTFTAWLVQYIPFAFGKGSSVVVFFVFAVVGMLALVDRWVGKHILQK